MTCGGPFFLRAGTQGSRPTRLGAGGSVLAVLTNPHSQPVLAYRVILHKGYGINAVVSHKAQACDSMGPTCMAAAGEDTPPRVSQFWPEGPRPGGWGGGSLAHGQTSECLGTPDGKE